MERTRKAWKHPICVAFARPTGYSDCIGGDDYLEIMQLFIERINEQIEAVKEDIAEIPYPIEPITADLCYPNDLSKSIDGKIVALKADVLRREYRIATHQILLVKGNNAP